MGKKSDDLLDLLLRLYDTEWRAKLEDDVMNLEAYKKLELADEEVENLQAEIDALTAERDALRKRIEDAPVATTMRDTYDSSYVHVLDLPYEWIGQRVRLVLEE